MKKTITLSLLFIAAAVVLVFYPAVQNGFSRDDTFNFINNYGVRTLSSLKGLFTRDYFRISNQATYRPVVPLLYILEYHFFGLNPRPYHIFNVVIHMLNVCAVFCLINLVSKNRRMAFLASFIFAIHPVQDGTVNGISFSADLWVTLFICLSMIGFFRYLEQGKALDFLTVLVSFLMALCSKESALIFPGLIILWFFILRMQGRKGKEEERDKRRRTAGVLISLLLITGVYSWIRFFVFTMPQTSNYVHPDFIKRLLFSGEIFFRYLKIIVNPFALKLVYPVSFEMGAGQYVHILFVAVLLAVVMALIKRSGSRELFFFYCWAIAFLLPVMGVFYPLYRKMADRYLYLPFVGISFLLAYIILYGARTAGRKFGNTAVKKVMAVLFICGFLVLCVSLNHKKLSFWKNDVVLYEQVLKENPGNSAYKLELAMSLYNDSKEQNMARIETLLADCEPVQKDDFGFNFLSGLCCFLKAEYEQARDYLKKAEGKGSDFYYQKAALYFAMGQCYYNLKQFDLAQCYYLKALDNSPNDINVVNSLAVLYAVLKEYDTAEKWLKYGLRIVPDNALLLQNLELVDKKRKNNSL